MPVYEPLTNESGEDRVPLVGEEDYLATILEVKENQRKDFTTGLPKLVWTIKLDIKSFADGAPAEDINGNTVTSRWIWKDVNPAARGYTAAGDPSGLRQFLLAAHGIADITAELPGGNTDDLVGRDIVLTIRTAPGQKDGKLRNYVRTMKPVSRRRGAAVGKVEAQAPSATGRQAPDNGATARTNEVDESYLKAVASLVSGTDEPSASEVAEVARQIGK